MQKPFVKAVKIPDEIVKRCFSFWESIQDGIEKTETEEEMVAKKIKLCDQAQSLLPDLMYYAAERVSEVHPNWIEQYNRWLLFVLGAKPITAYKDDSDEYLEGSDKDGCDNADREAVRLLSNIIPCLGLDSFGSALSELPDALDTFTFDQLLAAIKRRCHTITIVYQKRENDPNEQSDMPLDVFSWPDNARVGYSHATFAQIVFAKDLRNASRFFDDDSDAPGEQPVSLLKIMEMPFRYKKVNHVEPDETDDDFEPDETDEDWEL